MNKKIILGMFIWFLIGIMYYSMINMGKIGKSVVNGSDEQLGTFLLYSLLCFVSLIGVLYSSKKLEEEMGVKHEK